MNVLSQDLTQRRMEQMRCGVIALGVASPVAGHNRSRPAKLHFAGDLAKRRDAAIDPTHFVDVDAPAFALDLATVGDLPTRFDVERCLAQHYGDASVGKISLGDYLGADVERIVADECRCLITLAPPTFAEDVLSAADLLGTALFF